MMFKSLTAAIGAALLLVACADEPAQVAAPTASAPAPAMQSFAVYFAIDKSMLSPEANATIRQAAAAYRAGGKVSATGHTDTLGDATYNAALSQRRVDAVTAGLVAAGVPAAAVATGARGETSLAVPTADNVAEQKNRRVDIVVQAPAASNDAAYCAALSAKYREYSRAAQVSTEVANAMAACTAGRYAEGIPVLERTLSNDKIPLPPRT